MKIVLSNGVVVHLISAKVIVWLSVLLDTIFLCLLPFNGCTLLVIGELVVEISGSVIADRGSEAHLEISNSHILNLTNASRLFL